MSTPVTERCVIVKSHTEEVTATTSINTRNPTPMLQGHLESYLFAALVHVQRLWAQSTQLNLLEFSYEVVIRHPSE